ncbi:glycosyltransferase family 4 protein [Rheinheimera soli]|uniref:glycosyltransferase family 4 protein n=1 Tax=Rheinheimera soli TaxID=443616 RepID=UPI001E3D88B3|nr:glycosyltransferase family 4 protein [Rheinheimera soli]
MKILFISQLFDPEYSIKGLALMKHWVALGYDVEVITTFPNYPKGKVFDGYKVKFKEVKHVDGVKIVRLWSHISHSKSKVSRAATYLSFTFMALFTALFTKKPDLVYTYHPQSTTGIIGFLMLFFRKVPFVTDIQDLWPDALIATGMNKEGMLLKFIDFWCKLIYNKASQIVVLSEGFRHALIARGVCDEKINVVYNWCPEEQRIEAVVSDLTQNTASNGSAKLVYAGNMGAAQSLFALVEAAGGFSDTELSLTMVGGGVEKQKLQDFVVQHGYTNVKIGDYIPSIQVFDFLARADVLVVHLKDDPLFQITIPSKTQSSLAMEKPLLMAVGGEANQLIVDAEAGEVAEPCNVDSIRKAIRVLLSRRSEWSTMGRNARTLYLNKFSSAVGYSKLTEVIIKAVK